MKQMIASWSMVKVHGLMVAGPSSSPVFARSWAREDRRPAPSILGSRRNVVGSQADWLARPATEAPETQIYCTNYRSRAFPWLRLRTVVRGERASPSIVNRTTVLWSMWIVASLILAGLASGPIFDRTRGREVAVSRDSNGAPKIDENVFNRPRSTLPLTNGRKRT